MPEGGLAVSISVGTLEDAVERPDNSVIEEDLIPLVGQGDRAAFARLYQQAGPAVFAFSLSLLRSRADAEDALQDTFLKLRSAAHLYRPQGKPMAWILTITKNICRMKLRQRRRGEVVSIEETLPDLSSDRISDAEDRLMLEAAFRALSPQECQIVLLHAVSGLKHREIARLMELPLSTVLSKYNRSLKKLRLALEGTK